MKFSPMWPSLFATESGGIYHYGIRELSQWEDRFGYKLLRLPRSRVVVRAHRVVADAFLARTHGLNEVNHKNGNKGDNRVGNLEWCNRKQNMMHASDTGLLTRRFTAKTAEQIRIDHAAGVSVADLCSVYGYSERCMYNLLNGDIYAGAGGPIKPSGGNGRHRGEASPSSKLSRCDVFEIRAGIERGEPNETQAARYNVTCQTIRDIANGNTWGWLK